MTNGRSDPNPIPSTITHMPNIQLRRPPRSSPLFSLSPPHPRHFHILLAFAIVRLSFYWEHLTLHIFRLVSCPSRACDWGPASAVPLLPSTLFTRQPSSHTKSLLRWHIICTRSLSPTNQRPRTSTAPHLDVRQRILSFDRSLLRIEIWAVGYWDTFGRNLSAMALLVRARSHE